MLSSFTLVALSALSSTVVAQYTLPDGFDPSLADPNDKVTWCVAQQSSCPLICGGDFNKNDCDPETVSFNCVCSDGESPDLSEYTNTLPFFVCEETFVQCIDANASDAEAQQTCKDNHKCGTKDPQDAESSESTTSAPTTTGMATETATTTDTAEETATQTGGAMTIAQDHSAGAFAVALFAAFGLIL